MNHVNGTISFASLLILIAARGAMATVVYVDASATGAETGASWADAYTSLQDGLLMAPVFGADAIWVAEGTYTPDDGLAHVPGDPVETFQLLDGVALYGGFPAGGGDGTFEARDTATFETILSGDLNGDDDTVGTDDNSHHVVMASAVGATAVLDGCTIMSGYARQMIFEGGGLLCDGAPTINDCRFESNFAVGGGGGIYSYITSGDLPVLSDCTFTDNTADFGGGVCANVMMTNCTFVGNFAITGAALSIGRGTLTDCRFVDNFAVVYGGAITAGSEVELHGCTFEGNLASVGGAIRTTHGSASLTDCTFEANHAGSGGAMANHDSSPELLNCTFIHNKAELGGGAIFNSGASPVFTGCDFAENYLITLSIHRGAAVLSTDGGVPTFIGCTFSGNRAGYQASGGAIANDATSASIVNCRFIDNIAEVDGAAILNENGSDSSISGCLFSRNTSTNGGAIENIGSDPSIVNCTFHGNRATIEGGAIHADGASTCLIANCVIWGNTATVPGTDSIGGLGTAICSYSDVEGGVAGAGNIDVDPSFADAPSHDLRLTPGSPCIDAGDSFAVPPDVHDLDGDGDTIEPLSIDVDGDPRIVDDPDTIDTGVGFPTVDMGAQEFRPCLADCADGDGVVGVVDLLMLLANWDLPGECDTDFDGGIDVIDLLELLASWGDCT